MVEAIKEQSKIELLKNENSAPKNENNRQQAEIDEIKAFNAMRKIAEARTVIALAVSHFYGILLVNQKEAG